ncbi:E3 ubiquitin-protein ligase listerin [Vitis vinifera]|uniref:E3 ubiquitin-protein ligase listerin n=1 Tax=Vitis vinifera TaxID=29760 RepID=A0A438KNE0_VITVI|nr:E3 ubiquitin-protein ligase listerin [Vitis vinifera]
MGRQKGEGARSKSRPSSSSLAASLLPSGTAAVGFGGYVGSSRLDSSLASEEFSDIDSEMAQQLKRLARKDPTTKGNRLCDRGLEECSSELHVERTCAI